MNTPLELSEENRQLLEKLQLQDINRLIQTYQTLSSIELALCLLVGFFLLGYLIYLLVKFLRKRAQPSKEVVIRNQFVQLEKIQEQSQFLKESIRFIRTVLRERFGKSDQGLTDLELYAFFQGTALQSDGEKSLSLIDQGRFGQVELKSKEKESIRKFLERLYGTLRL